MGIMLALGLVSCDPKVQWQTYRNDDGHFSIDSPYPMTKGQREWFPVYMFTDKSYDRFQAGIGYRIKANNLSMDQIVQFMDEGMKKKLDQSGYNEKIDIVKIPGAEARAINGNLARDGKLRKMKMLIVEKGKNVWFIDINYDGNDDEKEAMADRIVKSFKILN